jgi:hypothetical protein
MTPPSDALVTAGYNSCSDSDSFIRLSKQLSRLEDRVVALEQGPQRMNYWFEQKRSEFKQEVDQLKLAWESKTLETEQYCLQMHG